MLSILAEITYRILETLDGEHGLKLIPYSLAQALKIKLLVKIK